LGPCIVIGDSLAVGVGQFRPDCRTIAQIGINSSRYIATKLPHGGISADTTVISLGVNDGVNIHTLDNLRTIRATVKSRMVYWLLPGPRETIRQMIKTVADEHHDQIIDTGLLSSPGQLHPNGRGYQTIALETRGEAFGAASHATEPGHILRHGRG